MTGCSVDDSGVRLRELDLADIPRLATFAPEDWHLALDVCDLDLAAG